MGKTETNPNGEFFVEGSESEILKIDPKVNVYHDCNDLLVSA